ncbi:uncharacterized protein MYCFIDRAFT_171613 [Pseudocercospora fijiensis CIRAD86]|uniref:Uncharacterized protein n=1 Tax=Pseudocercospora fijiensis (strain CIRAD86) TaxID=383855 RepID=M3B8S8_PSEFD|nr:uncharacterized protein MYCFIDRAFT_171613 [Pseudocercospora fijiensis CIRAD86]EME85737.1 hypothetical protein MYCFIDRAFT_171613 [Pseudocercospora fijiensis CIRAD86]
MPPTVCLDIGASLPDYCASRNAGRNYCAKSLSIPEIVILSFPPAAWQFSAIKLESTAKSWTGHEQQYHGYI